MYTYIYVYIYIYIHKYIYIHTCGVDIQIDTAMFRQPTFLEHLNCLFSTKNVKSKDPISNFLIVLRGFSLKRGQIHFTR